MEYNADLTMVTCLLWERTVGLTFTHWLCETAFIFLLAGVHVGKKAETSAQFEKFRSLKILTAI